MLAWRKLCGSKMPLPKQSLSQLAAYRALSDMGKRYMCELAAEVGLEASLALEGAGDETVSPRTS